MAKILLLPPKYEIIMLPSNYYFSNIAIAILDFSLLLLVKLSLLIIFGMSSMLLSKSVKERQLDAVAIVGRAITKWGAIEKSPIVSKKLPF